MNNNSLIESARKFAKELEEHVHICEAKGIACGEERVILKKVNALIQYHE